jgi:HicB family
MDLQSYVENIQHQLEAAADAAGEDARALAERLVSPLDAAIRLALQDALATAVEEITCELAPGSVELRLRGRELEFVVIPPPIEPAESDQAADNGAPAPDGWPAAPRASAEGDEGGMSRINLRLPEHLKARIERDADGERISVNAWLVRAAAAALERTDGRRHERRAPHRAQRYTGWVR